MNVLVTGAGGFIGSAVCGALLARGATVHALITPAGSRRRLGDIASSLDLVECDLLAGDTRALRELGPLDACIHCAWFVQPDRYLTALENLTWMQRSLALFQELAQADCRRIVGVGTCFEYQPSTAALDEQTQLAPATLYAATKASTFLSARSLLRQLGVSFAWARIFYLFGPDEHPLRLVPAVACALLEGRPVDLTHGRQVRDYAHVADVGAALAGLALHEVEGPINVGSGYPATVREVAEHLGRIFDRADLLRFGARAERAGDPPCVLADTRALRATGWSPRFDLESGLADTATWWRKHGCKSPA